MSTIIAVHAGGKYIERGRQEAYRVEQKEYGRRVGYTAYHLARDLIADGHSPDMILQTTTANGTLSMRGSSAIGQSGL